MHNFELLDNPVWHALQTVHKPFALGTGTALRYPATVLPFIGYDHQHAPNDLAPWMAPGEHVYIVGEMPAMPHGWTFIKSLECIQMLCMEVPPITKGAIPIVKIGIEDNEEMVAFTNSVQPGFFKQDTHLLGNYYGIKIDGRIVATAGERMHITGLTEVSAVCTHPDFTGRGFAQQLSAHVCRHIFEQGNVPYLHVLTSNTRAIAVYERLGFTKRRDIAFNHVAFVGS